MNPFRKKRPIQTEDITKALGEFVHSSTELCGAVFVLLEGRSEALNTALPLAQKAATTHNACFIGMMSGLMQFLIQDSPSEPLEEKTKALAKEIAKLSGPHTLVVWTVQRCVHGCWGDDTSVSYGALVPNFRQIIKILGSAHGAGIFKV